MSRTHGILKKTILAVGVIVGTMAPGAPALADAAGSAPGNVSARTQLTAVTPVATNQAATGDAGTMALYWVECTISSERTRLIFLRGNISCAFGGEVGFSALITNTSTSRTIKICNQSTRPFYEDVNPANPDGSATGQIIPYVDQPGGGCYVRTVGYPIRKFRATFDGVSSPWSLPY